MTEGDQQQPGGSRTKGAQTLARGLRVLKFVAAARDGVSIAQVAEFVQVHRSMAYRVLETLCDSGLVARLDDGRYHGAAGLLALARGGYSGLRQVALGPVQAAADQLGVTVALLVAEGPKGHESAVAVLVCAPVTRGFHITFTEGSTHPLDRGAAGRALSALLAGGEVGDYYTTFGEVEPQMHGLSVPLGLGPSAPAACLVVISQREVDPHELVPVMKEAAERIRAAG